MNNFLFIFNFFINAIFVFFTTAFLIEILLFVLRIKNYRLRYFARLIPIFKLFLDLAIYNFSNWGILDNLNPITCEKGTRTLSIFLGMNSKFDHLPLTFTNVLFHFENGKTFSSADILAATMKPYFVISISIFFLTLASFALIRFFMKYKKNIFLIKNIVKNLKPLNHKIRNENLRKKLYSKKIILAESKKISSPCFIKHKKNLILFPKKCLKILNEREIEAIIHHELQHIIWKDGIFNFLISIISSIFSYIPFLKIWLKKIKKEREYACDQNAKANSLDLASALKKCSYLNFKEQFATSFIGKESLKRRISILLYSKKRTFSKFPKILQAGIFSVILLVILFGKFWIF